MQSLSSCERKAAGQLMGLLEARNAHPAHDGAVQLSSLHASNGL